ncbi:3-hydroxyacyl-CoA dehydrogenase NAD-binding domain-containing protein [Suttonella sp. R2A3]|uniref:3-hydroxyacyl-CoA dehydrogenase family protein n=1 Tax=Suttonella sp. R2A3 TaxID=2908648 RepID=UPI001F1AB6E5|nr:3-hydroxyacyl-CoA dehydrogenase NAD-binding domain-containing protein [Suttonella sp. R2A3]UJF24484.1 3-hydroxyacyl-CoA dehydrogenase NAD-binding domain-containing protein [Suttonella sp. R2A3]
MVRQSVSAKTATVEAFFYRPAILGATEFGAQIAALFANAGIHVRLYDKPHPEDPNFYAQQAIEQLYRMRPSPFTGVEAGNWIEARNYRDHRALLSEHDLIIECLDDDLVVKQGLLSRLAPVLARDVVVLSHSAGLSMKAVSQALPAWLRSRLLGAHFFRPPRFQRLLEVVRTERSEQRLHDQVCGYFTERFGLHVLSVPDTPDYVSTRLVMMLMNAVFYHAERAQLDWANVEALTKMLIGRTTGGVCYMIDYIGLARWQQFSLNIPSADKEYFAERIALPSWLSALLAAGREGRAHYLGFYDYRHRPYYLLDLAGNELAQASVNDALLLSFEQRDWSAMCALECAQAQFVCALLRDCWQIMAWVSQTSGQSGQALDDILTHGFSWQNTPYHLLQAFSPAKVLADTERAYREGAIDYPVLRHWTRRSRRQVTTDVRDNAFSDDARLLWRKTHSSAWVYHERMLIWQPNSVVVALDEETLAELLSACQEARLAQWYLVIYHHGEQFGLESDLALGGEAHQQEQTVERLHEVLMALRTHPHAVMISISGTLGDFGAAILMQADQVLCEAGVRWKLSAPMYRLPPLGVVWFEWLRRLPYLGQAHYLEQIHSVLSQSVTAHPPSDIHVARSVGILRVHDRVVANPAALAKMSKELADGWLTSRQPRTPRQAQYTLAHQEVDVLMQRALSSEQPELYRGLLRMLSGQRQNVTVSLRMLLKEELLYFARLIAKDDSLE